MASEAPPGGQAFLEAAKSGDIGQMEPLLQSDPSLLTYQGKGCPLGFIGHSALHWAAAKNNTELAKWLIYKHSISLALRNNAESTPLHTAAQNGHLQVCELLLQAGADPLLLDAEGSSPLAVAKERGHSAVAKALEKGAAVAQLAGTLRAMGERDESSWKVSEMKSALRLSGHQDVETISEKVELVRLTRELVAEKAAAVAAAAAAAAAAAVAAPAAVNGSNSAASAAASSAPPASADRPSGAQPKASGGAGAFFAAARPAAKPAAPKAAAAAAKAPAKDDADSSDDESNAAAIAAGAERAKAAGNEAFGKGDFQMAAKQFGIAIRLAPKNHVLYSNRSGAYASLGKGTEALSDAEKCVELAPSWAKGYGRKGAALILCGQYKKAIGAYKAGLEVEPANAGLLKGLEDLRTSLRDGEAPDISDGRRPTAAAPAAPARADAPAPPPKAKPSSASNGSSTNGGGGSGVSSSLPIGQQWIEHAKRGDRPAMEALLAQDESLVSYKARGIGHTAMHWAASSGDRQMMQWLLSLGADVNARNTSDATPLHTAAASGQAFALEWLLAHGADGTLKNDDDLTPAAMAKKKNRPDLATTIDQHMANPPPPPVEAAQARQPHEEEVD